MSVQRFEELLKEVGQLLGVPLRPDTHQACRLNINGVLHIQIEEAVRKDALLVAAFLCEIPPGKFRENVLKDALKSNGVHPRIGTLAYSDKNHHLTCFEFLPWPHLTAHKFVEFLAKFIDKADSWLQAISSGRAAPESREKQTPPPQPSLFGRLP